MLNLAALVYYLMLLFKFLTLCLFSIPLNLSRPAEKSITTGIEVFFNPTLQKEIINKQNKNVSSELPFLFKFDCFLISLNQNQK